MNGFYNKHDYLFLTMLVLFSFTFSIFLVINNQFLYWVIINFYALGKQYHVSNAVLLHNLQVMTNFIQNPFATKLNLLSYQLSNGAFAHFTDVRKLVLFNNFSLLLSGVYLGYAAFKHSFQQLWKLTDYLKRVMITLLLFLLLVALDFNDIFIYLHQMIFPNHNWIFNPKKDPIINVLPDQYFFLCLITWFGILFLCLCLFYGYGKWQIKKQA